MLNQYLTESELQSELKDFLDAYNFIFSQLEPEREITIYQDKKLLALLHHAFNIEKYSQKSFRQRLLAVASDEKIASFAKSRNIRYHTLEETREEEFRNKLAAFSWGNNNDTKKFVEIFDYPKYLIPGDTEENISEDVISPSQNPFEQLKDHQVDVAFRSMALIDIPNTKFLIHMPTGAGKTRVAMEIISHFLNKKKGRQVVWLADRMELCEQAMGIFLNVWSHLGRHGIKIYRMWGTSNIPAEIQGSAFIVAMYQKIRYPLQKKHLKLKADLIVPDEAHNAIAPTYQDVISDLKDRREKQTRIMGLTATPGRGSSNIDESNELSRFFDMKIVDINTDQGVIEFLQKKRILSRCIRSPLNTNIKYTLTKDQWIEISKSFEREFPDGLLEKIANDQRRNMKIILKLREIAKNYKHVLVFCGSKKQSKLLSGFMLATGHQSAHVDGTSPKNYRKDVVDRFRNGELQFVFNYNIFTAGFDAPRIDAVVIARPTRSVVLYGQMIGRGMRGSEIGGTEEFLLVDVVDNIITQAGGLDDVHDYFTEYWNDKAPI